MKAHHQNTERLIKEISAEKSTNIAVVFHTSRGKICPPRSQWIHRSMVPPEHERLLTCAPLHCLRGTRFTPFTDLICSSFTRWQTKMMGTYCWLAPRMIKCLHLFFPSVSSSSPAVFSFAVVGLELSRPSCSYMDNNRLTPSWAVQEPQKTIAPSPLAAESYSENLH